jgi:ADP-heptose:LPS heptosyltransferase
MKILVVSLAGIGDTLFTTPLIHELRANFPDATIEALVRWHGAHDLLAHNPHLNAVHRKDLVGTSKRDGWQYLSGLRRNRYDLTINTHPQSHFFYRLAAWRIGAPTRFSHVYECSGVLDRLLVNLTLPQDYTKHAVENNLAVLPLIGGKALLPRHELEIYTTAPEEAWATEYINANQLAGKKLAGIHVGSGGTKNLALRRWPLGNYIELARQLRELEPATRILFFGGPGEKTAHEQIRSALGERNLFFPATPSFPQAARLIKACAVFLSVDTVMMHFAAAMKVPRQVVIETPTWNKPIEPYANLFTLVRNPVVNGRGLEYYRYDGGDIKGTSDEIIACMSSVTVEKVLPAMLGQARVC